MQLLDKSDFVPHYKAGLRCLGVDTTRGCYLDGLVWGDVQGHTLVSPIASRHSITLSIFLFLIISQAIKNSKLITWLVSS